MACERTGCKENKPMGVSGDGIGKPVIIYNGLASGEKPWDCRMAREKGFAGFTASRQEDWKFKTMRG